MGRALRHGPRNARGCSQPGRAEDSWRTTETRFHRLRANRSQAPKSRPTPRRSGKRWLTFLANHREVIVAFDFFTVPTLTFQLLYSFLVIEHGRRKFLHFNVTRRPTAEWVVQQLREAFSEASPYRYVILDRDSKFDDEVITS